MTTHSFRCNLRPGLYDIARPVTQMIISWQSLDWSYMLASTARLSLRYEDRFGMAGNLSNVLVTPLEVSKQGRALSCCSLRSARTICRVQGNFSIRRQRSQQNLEVAKPFFPTLQRDSGEVQVLPSDRAVGRESKVITNSSGDRVCRSHPTLLQYALPDGPHLQVPVEKLG